MATGNDSRPRAKVGTTATEDDATITRGMRVCYVGTSTEANSDTGLLSELGARVERFDSAEQGFKAVLEKDYDLLLVNLTANTGGLGVPEFVRLVRNCGHPGKVQLPIMAIANQRQLQHAARLKALGADELIGTPIDIAVLHAKIGNLLRKRMDRNPVRNNALGAKDRFESLPQARPTPLKGEQNKTYVNAPAESNASENLVKEVALMKQKFDLPATTPGAHPEFPQGAGEAKGFLERLSNRILGRLAKTAVVATPAVYKAERGTPNTFNAAGENPFAPPSGAPTPTIPGSDSDHISQVLRGLSRVATPTVEGTLAIPPVPHSGVAKKASPALHSAKSTIKGETPSATPANGSFERPTTKPSASRGNVRVRQPYVSPIVRIGGARVNEKPAANLLLAQTSETAAPGRLSDAEKSRVYDRVKNLVSSARRATDQPPAVAIKSGPGKSLRICFLEDSCTSSHAIREMLGEEHHEVDHFSSAEEALDAIMEKNYDVVLASQIVALGGLDCISLIRTIRSAPDIEKSNVSIVAITANPDAANIEPFFIAGANDVLVKPIEGKELNKRLVETVNARTSPQPSKVIPQFKPPETALKICFLEDSCTSSHAIREMLGEKGHEVDHFSSAEEALDAISEKNYDLVLASQIVALGGMDCEQLVRTVSSGAKGNLPVTVITANPEPENINKFHLAGASDVILKPVEGSELNERLLSVVVQSKSADEPLAAPPVQAKTLHVCFLEDSCTSSHAIREMLGEQGHQVDHFSTPEETLDAFLDIEYDVLLASQINPGGGLDTEGLVRRVRAAGQKKQRPIVLLTTDPSPENKQRFRRAGVNDVIVKPVELNLAHRLLDVVGRRQTAPDAVPTSAPNPIAVPEVLHVCFLEDSCTSSHAIREMLSEAGHEVDHFTSAEEALDAFLEKPYDLLLASQIVALGGLDCEGLVKTIRGQGKSLARFSPIVVITANGEPGNIESFTRVGADAVIVKPIEGSLSDQLKQTVGQVLSKPTSPQLRVVPRAGQLPRHATTKAPAGRPITPANSNTISVASSSPTLAENSTPQPPSLLDSIASTSTAAAAKKSGLGSIEFPRIKLPQMSDVTSATVKAAAARAGLTPERKMILAMFVVGIIAVVLMNWHHFSDSTPVNVATVERGPIYSSLNAPGMIVSKKKVELTTSVPGQITKVLVKEGDVVSKGDVLATLDDRDARIQMQRADANLESARKDVALNERTMDRLARALQMGAVSRQMAEDAEAAVNAARAKQRVAEEEFRAAQLFTDRLNVTAPFDGVVTANFAVEGLWAEPPGPLFTVVDMNQREIELHLDTADVNRINVGQRVTLSSDAFPGDWTEQVVRVAPAASRQGGMANVINVYTTLGPDAPALRYGQQVDGQIRIAANDNALKVPFSALTTRNQRAVIGIVEDDRLQFVPVKTGIESGTHVEIREGLKAGDQVVLINKELEDGIHVTPVDLHN